MLCPSIGDLDTLYSTHTHDNLPGATVSARPLSTLDLLEKTDELLLVYPRADLAGLGHLDEEVRDALGFLRLDEGDARDCSDMA